MRLGYVIGAGKARFALTSRLMVQLAQEVTLRVLDDAGHAPSDLHAVVVANFLGGPNDGQLHLNSVVAGLMPGLNPRS